MGLKRSRSSMLVCDLVVPYTKGSRAAEPWYRGDVVNA